MAEKVNLPTATLEHVKRDNLTKSQLATHFGLTEYELEQAYDLSGVEFAKEPEPEVKGE